MRRRKPISRRASLDGASLAELFAWSEQEFLDHTAGVAITAPAMRGQLRNIAGWRRRYDRTGSAAVRRVDDETASCAARRLGTGQHSSFRS